MQIDRNVHTPQTLLGKSGAAYCALECVNCTGICLSVYYMLTPDERLALAEMSGGSSAWAASDAPEHKKMQRH